ncbi:MAG: hypothetical protein H0X27_04070 [Caulobacteraceae bacterium]|nr:hypothetical protein [Caulobacteraceae bacterium]
MIVGGRFEGDDDEWTQFVQHDAYGVALAMIVDACRQYARFARAVGAGADRLLDSFLARSSFDHRIIQPAHDLLAATWRARDGIAPTLPFGSEEERRRERRNAWLAWLEGEVASWIDEPALVRAFIVAVATDDQVESDRAEAVLIALTQERCRLSALRPLAP